MNMVKVRKKQIAKPDEVDKYIFATLKAINNISEYFVNPFEKLKFYFHGM